MNRNKANQFASSCSSVNCCVNRLLTELKGLAITHLGKKWRGKKPSNVLGFFSLESMECYVFWVYCITTVFQLQPKLNLEWPWVLTHELLRLTAGFSSSVLREEKKIHSKSCKILLQWGYLKHTVLRQAYSKPELSWHATAMGVAYFGAKIHETHDWNQDF